MYNYDGCMQGPPCISEASLLAATNGVVKLGYEPCDKLETAGRVSVICPTTDERVMFHTQLYACFAAQNWADKELVIVDTGKTPSPFLERKALDDQRVIYRHFQCSSNLWSVGLKRNIAVAIASGEVIAHFDDDDLYAPCYIERMRHVLAAGAGATLSKWFVFDICTGNAAFVNPDPRQEDWILGYGFSHVYQRRACLARPFPHEHFGEDYKFMAGVRQGGGLVKTFPDTEGIVLHMQQGLNLSNSHGQRVVSVEEVMRLHVAALDGVEELLDMTCMNASTNSPFISTGDAYQMYLRPTPHLPRADMLRGLCKLGVCPFGSDLMGEMALRGEPVALLSFYAKRRGEIFVEPGRIVSRNERFGVDALLPGDVVRTISAEQAAFLHLTRLLLRRCPPGVVLAGSDYEGFIKLQLQNLSHIAILSTVLLFTRHFPRLRIEIDFGAH